MEKSRFELSGIGVSLYSDPAPRRLFLQPVDEHDGALLDRQIELMGAVPRPFALAAFAVADWSRDLSPWEAPAVFGSVPFGGKAEETFYFVVERLLPALRERLRLGEDTALYRVILGSIRSSGAKIVTAKPGKRLVFDAKRSN